MKIKAIAKNDTMVFFLKDPKNQFTYDKKIMLKGMELNLPLHSDKKIDSHILDSILGRQVIFVEGDHFISTYSNDFIYQN